MQRVCTSSIIVKLSIGGVSLIVADVRFESFSQNLVTYDGGGGVFQSSFISRRHIDDGKFSWEQTIAFGGKCVK